MQRTRTAGHSRKCRPTRRSRMPSESRCPSSVCGKKSTGGTSALLRTGSASRGGRATKHPEEGPALRKLLGVRLKGVSLRGIARWLDEQGVPTRRRGKGWHSQVVKLIADRTIGKNGSGGTKA